jgi:hypothetical protein
MTEPTHADLRALLARPRGAMTVNELYEVVGHLSRVLAERDRYHEALDTIRGHGPCSRCDASETAERALTEGGPADG